MHFLISVLFSVLALTVATTSHDYEKPRPGMDSTSDDTPYKEFENATRLNGDALRVALTFAGYDFKHEPPQSCPDDYPHECKCYREGTTWCGFPVTGSMRDYREQCEATRHVEDIINTLCTLKYVGKEKWPHTWSNKKVDPGQNIYFCWPMKLVPPLSPLYQ